MPSFLSEQDLIQGLIAQSDHALQYLYDEVGPKVRQYIVNAGGSSEEANDIFQEGIISAFVNIQSGRYQASENAKFTTYLMQVCKYKWYDLLKSAGKSKTGGEMIDFASDDSIVDDMMNSEKYVQLHGLIDQLGDQCREILHRFYWLDESLEEISAALKMVSASVKNGKYRCMQKLKVLAIEVDNLR